MYFFFKKNSLYALTGKPESGSELGVGHRLSGGEHRGSGSEGGEASPGAGSALADHQDRSVRQHRAQPQRRYVLLLLFRDRFKECLSLSPM